MNNQALHLSFFEVPKIETPDWEATAAHVKAHGPVIISPQSNHLSAHACLHKHGLGVYMVKAGGKLIAYSIEPKRKNGR
jgi:hypothetical protein